MWNPQKTKSLVIMLTSSLLFACSIKHEPVVATANAANKQARPNIILVVTDDQGYGDFGFNQNPIIKTPNLDKLADESVQLTNFHVDPTCSPTRAALMTGKHSLRAGVWHTILARYFLGQEHQTLASRLQQGGYDTAIFGKWHLGDNYPYRPQDHGFKDVLIHGGGGVGQTPDHWGNTQFDDVFYRNGKAEQFSGYATKVWFDEAIQYISKKRENPYFAYIALNAPHGPQRAPAEYVQRYLDMGLPNHTARFYAMATYVDEQIARLQQVLKAQGQLDNTLFIFMTDNGSSLKQLNKKLALKDEFAAFKQQYPSWQPNAGLNGYKSSVYEGGHRVPIIIQYPKLNLTNRKIDTLTAHYDLLPTILDWAGVDYQSSELDGHSLVELLTTGADPALTNRSIIVTNQRVDKPSFKRPIMLAQGDWRYIKEDNSRRLYNLKADKAQQQDVSAEHPALVEQFEQALVAWWHKVEQEGFKERYIHVGDKAENPVRLNAMDWKEVPDKQPVPWFIGHQIAAEEVDYTHWLTEEDKYHPLPWYIDVVKSGDYQIRAYFHDKPAATPIGKKWAVVEIDGIKHVSKVYGRAHYANFNLPLKQGKQKIRAWFTDDKTQLSEQKAAFYLYLKLENQ